MPAAAQAQINPGNPLQRVLLQRLDALAPPEIDALLAGISPQALMVLRKVLPELGMVWNMVAQVAARRGGGMNGPPMGANPGAQMTPGPGARPMQAPGAPQPAPQTAGSRLNSMG